MASVIFIDHTGNRHTVAIPDGNTVMQAAVNNNLPGITAECGGGLACATCHCYVDDAWVGKVGGPSSDAESEMLDAVASERKPSSRLSCQITVTAELDGLVVHVPERQY